MRIAHVSDFHFTQLTWNPFRLLSKRILGNLNWVFSRKKHFFEHQVEPLPELFRELEVDLILLGGDFSTTALTEEFQKARSFVKKFQQPWIAIPGNHDRYTRRSCRHNHFYRYFANQREQILHPAELFTLKEHRVEAHKIQENWWVIGLDTAIATRPYSSQGIFSEKLQAYLEEILALIPPTDSIILLNHYPFLQNDVTLHNLVRAEALETLLKQDSRIRLYLHGHTHRHCVADLQINSLPLVLDSGSCAQGRKGAWNLIDLRNEGCTISTYRWDHRWTKTRTEDFVWTRK